MALTDIVFEAADPSFPLADLTRAQHDVDVAFRAGLAHPDGYRGLAHVTAPREVTRGIEKAGPTAGAWSVRVLSARDASADVVVTPRDVPIVPLAVLAARAAFGPGALVTPVRTRGGVTRLRVLAPGHVDQRDAGVRLRRAFGGNGGARAVRVVRVTPVPASAFATACRGVLTTSEEDVLALAWDMGYYAKPKGCNLEGIAERLGVSASPIHKRLKSAEHALVGAFATPTDVSATRAKRAGRGRALVNATEADELGVTSARILVNAADAPVLTASANAPGARLVAHATGVGDVARSVTRLVIATGPDAERARVLSALADARGVVHVHPTAGTRDATVAVVTSSADVTHARWSEDPLPLDALARVAGPGAFVKSALLEGGQLWLRALLPERTDVNALNTRFADAGVDARVVTARPPRGLPGGRGVTALTPRQEETLRLAHALGYYRTPRACTLETVADALSVSANAVHKNLTAAEGKIVSNYLAHTE